MTRFIERHPAWALIILIAVAVITGVLLLRAGFDDGGSASPTTDGGGSTETTTSPDTTGASADHRLALRAGEIESFARALARALKVAGTPAPGPLPERAQAWIEPLAADLLARKGRGLVLVGAGQPASLHALGHALNAALGNLGKTVRLIDPIEARPGEVIVR